MRRIQPISSFVGFGKGRALKMQGLSLGELSDTISGSLHDTLLGKGQENAHL